MSYYHGIRLDGNQFENYCIDRIRNTKELRVSNPRVKCPTNYNKCHIVGLNLLKELFNRYGLKCRDITADECIKHVRSYANEGGNLYCCTDVQNNEDKFVEKEVLASLFENRLPKTEEATKMLESFRNMLVEIQGRLSKTAVGTSRTLNEILIDIDKLRA